MAAPPSSRRAIKLTAPRGDGLRIPRPWASASRAVRIWAPPPAEVPPATRRRVPTALRSRAGDGAAGAAAPSDGGPPVRPLAHTVRLATPIDLMAMAAIERACGNPAWGLDELQVR
jgi:hypothetical protein